MKKKIFFLGTATLIILGLFGCTKNKFKPTSSQPIDIPYYNSANDSCFVCHNDPSLKKTIGAETVPLYVDRERFARSIHRANRCLDCHTDIVFYKGHSEAVKTYGGWANFSAEDTSQTRNYHTSASISCGNCHTDQSGFFSSQHYLIEDIKQSRQETHDGMEIGKDYDEAKCGKCHLTCATCHFKGERVQQNFGEITDYWSQLLTGNQVPGADEMTDWSIDWTTNIESHDFAKAEDLEGSNDLCRVCHTGYYTQYGVRGFPNSDTLVHDMITSQGVVKYPQYEEWSFLKGDISVMTGVSYLDSIYARMGNSDHYSRKCIDCHDKIHSLTPITCLKCHADKVIPKGREHSDVGCEACHDATMKPFRVNYSVFPRADTVRAAAIKDNKVIDWRSHMIVDPRNTLGVPDFCIYKCHNPVGQGTVGAPKNFEIMEIHDQDDK